MPVKSSVYETTEAWRDDIKHGFDYEGQVLKKSLSHEIYKDPVRSSMVSSMEPIVFELIEAVKKIKTFVDWRKKRDYRKFN